jgi:acetyl-CoA carboxylase carboxyltransferase component
MDPEIAAEVVRGSSTDEDRQRLPEAMIGDLSPYPAAGAYYVQDIIDPRDTRDYLIRVLKIVRESKGGGISHHNLANWPTKF